MLVHSFPPSPCIILPSGFTELQWREKKCLKKKPRLDFANVETPFHLVCGLQEKNRNTSLYSEHKKAAVPKEKEEDDPSKRAFDKEKDMGGGIKIGHAQKKELLNRAADFGSRFAGGKYL